MDSRTTSLSKSFESLLRIRAVRKQGPENGRLPRRAYRFRYSSPPSFPVNTRRRMSWAPPEHCPTKSRIIANRFWIRFDPSTAFTQSNHRDAYSECACRVIRKTLFGYNGRPLLCRMFHDPGYVWMPAVVSCRGFVSVAQIVLTLRPFASAHSARTATYMNSS